MKRNYCRQAEDVRASFCNIPLVDVYIAALPEGEKIGEVECKARRDEIHSASNERVRREKYFVWKLLCYALERSFGMRGDKLKLVKEDYGGWFAGDAFVSLSHSEGALAVAVSQAPVGVDIERLKVPRSKKAAERIMTSAELLEYGSTPLEKREKRLIEIWTAKEAIFKSKRISGFIPKENDTLSESFVTRSAMVGGEEYVWSVATAAPEKIRLFENIDLGDIGQ